MMHLCIKIFVNFRGIVKMKKWIFNRNNHFLSQKSWVLLGHPMREAFLLLMFTFLIGKFVLFNFCFDVFVTSFIHNYLLSLAMPYLYRDILSRRRKYAHIIVLRNPNLDLSLSN